MGIIRGKVLKYGDNINTDIISPPQYMELSVAEAAKHAMGGVDPDFSRKAGPGTILVAGNNLGSGSSRETSPLTLKHLGVSTIIAKSFARIFYRNCINVGILAVECGEVDKIENLDELTVDVKNGAIRNESSGENLQCGKIPPHIMDLLESGGLVEYIKQNMQ